MPSLSARDEIEINADPEKVFNVIADYQHMHTWFPTYNCEVLGGEPIKAGTKVSHKYGKPPIILSKFTRRIDRLVLGESIEESYIEGDLRGTGVWSFEKTKTGTLASFICNVTSQSLLTHIGILLTGNKSHKQVYKTLLTNLKTHCEA